jgi:four helix bundle protein
MIVKRIKNIITKKMKSYKDLDIYNLSLALFYKTHTISLKLPQYELHELGSQIRRSSDSVATNIVEGYGRKRYKQDFIKFLTYSHASNLDTLCHLEKLQFLYPDLSDEFEVLKNEYDILGAKLFSFLRYVENNWNKFE